jgi:hypothetical protein
MANSVEWQDTSAAVFKNTSAAVWRKHGLTHDTLTEGVEFSDLVSVRWNLLTLLSDGLKLSDTTIAAFIDTLTDGIKLSDNSGEPVMTYLEELLDGIKFSDTPSALAIFLAAVTEGIVFAEVASPKGTQVGIVTEGIKFSDASAVRATFKALAPDGIVFSDLAISAFVETLSDGVKFSDSVVGYFAELVQDGIKFSDTTTALATLLAEAIDSVVFSDAPVAAFTEVVTDGIKLSDTLEALMTYLPVAADGIKFSDQTAAAATEILTVGIEFGAYTQPRQDYMVTLIEGMVLSDTTVGIAVESLSDGLKLSDSSGEPIAKYHVLSADTIVFSDRKTIGFKNCVLQDYTTYTRVEDSLDDRGDILIEGPQVIGLRRDSGGDAVRRANFDYIYKDFGADYFGDFRCDIRVDLTQISDFGGGYNVFSASNILGPHNTQTDRVGIQIEGNWQYNIIRCFGPTSKSIQFSPPRWDAYGLNYFIRFERIGYDLTIGIYTDDSFSTLRNNYFGGTPMEGTVTIDTADRYQYFYTAGGFGTGYGLYPTVLGEVLGHTICDPITDSFVRADYRVASSDGLVFSEDEVIGRHAMQGQCSDAIVFNDTAIVRVDYGVEVNDTFVFNEYQQVAWMEQLSQGIRFGDSTIWIRPYDKDEIDVQPKGLDYTFKALAKITNFTAFKKQFATDAFDLSIPIAIQIHPQETDFKALSKPFDFKAQPKDFNTEV